eukprot:GFKZ01000720.1.p1 GENE.GFKZ01000720.1~~GFKZ01000720.1.p1  ORF type:complete len:188 (-),score=14.22 GFKZ01000720.1:71-577(-)
MATAFCSTIVIICLLGISSAMIPSTGTSTADAIRSNLVTRDFRIDIESGIAVEARDFSVRIADVNTYPAMGGADVQSAIVRATIMARRPFFRHYHPRGTETLNLLEGEVRVSFKFEGLGETRVVTNRLMAGQSTVFPQGLVHETFCVSDVNCTFLSVFNTADPGTVPS